jgi:hypothetical protein
MCASNEIHAHEAQAMQSGCPEAASQGTTSTGITGYHGHLCREARAQSRGAGGALAHSLEHHPERRLLRGEPDGGQVPRMAGLMVRGRVRPGDPTPSSQRRTEAGSRTGEARRHAARAQRRVLDAAEYDALLQPIVRVLDPSHRVDGHHSACLVEYQQGCLVTGGVYRRETVHAPSTHVAPRRRTALTPPGGSLVPGDATGTGTLALRRRH